MSDRKIAHIDMDAFYAAIEQRDHPELQGRPIAVGGSSKRGVVMTASYEARPYGVHSAMPSVEAARRCPDLIFVPSRMDVYKEESQRIRAIFERYTDRIEPLSLDEAYLDLTAPKVGPPSATIIANRIRQAIADETGLTASAGVSSTKFVAKLASDVNKPNGICVVAPRDVESFISERPIEDFHGVGPVTAKRMQDLNIHTGADLQAASEDVLVKHFGKRGRFFYRIARGDDPRPVRTDRTRKSVGAERTFSSDLDQIDRMEARLKDIASRVAKRLDRGNLRGHTVTLKVKYADFTMITRQKTLDHTVQRADDLYRMGCRLLREVSPEAPVRLLGLSVHKLVGRDCQRGRQLEFAFAR
jgi:DNA polymerase-4